MGAPQLAAFDTTPAGARGVYWVSYLTAVVREEYPSASAEKDSRSLRRAAEQEVDGKHAVHGRLQTPDGGG